jgi:hypothetical protein
MVMGFTSAVTCRTENKRLIGTVRGSGGEETVDFTFMLSEVSGPQREHSSYVICMCYDLPLCAACHVCTPTATKHDGYAWIIMLRKKYENCLLRAVSVKRAF